MTKQITWTNEKRTLRSLAPWDHNPRYIKDAQAERLLESFNEFGQVLPICIGPNNEVYDGHQRRNVIGAADEYGLDYEIDVRVASRELTERERQKLTVYLHKGAAGDWDWEELANWGIEGDLVEWGFDDIGAIMEASALTEIGDASTGDPTDRDLGDKRRQIKPVIYVDEVHDFEKAILATGLKNRGSAIMAICRHYLEEHGEEEQFDFTFESFPEV